MAKQPEHNCPFAGKVDLDTNQHVEGRFAHLETEVSGLKSGLANLEQAQNEGFRTVFNKLDSSNAEMRQAIQASANDSRNQVQSIAVTRAGNIIPWITVGILVLGLAITVGYQAVSGISLGVEKADANMKLSTTRELDYREAKGRADAQAEHNEKALETFMLTYQTAHKELDEKLQHETAQAIAMIDVKVTGLENRIQSDMMSWRKMADDRMNSQSERLAVIDERQIKIMEVAAEQRGEVKARIDGLETVVKTLLQIQLDKLHDYNSRAMDSKQK